MTEKVYNAVQQAYGTMATHLVSDRPITEVEYEDLADKIDRLGIRLNDFMDPERPDTIAFYTSLKSQFTELLEAMKP